MEKENWKSELEERYGAKLAEIMSAFKTSNTIFNHIDIWNTNVRAILTDLQEVVPAMIDEVLNDSSDETLLNLMDKILYERIYIKKNRVIEITDYLGTEIANMRVFLEVTNDGVSKVPTITISRIKKDDFMNRSSDTFVAPIFNALLNSIDVEGFEKDPKRMNELKDLNNKWLKTKNVMLKQMFLEGWKVIHEIESKYLINNARPTNHITMFKTLDDGYYNIQTLSFDKQSNVYVGINSNFFLTNKLIERVIEEFK